ncbi:hypothetical protein OX459_04820 [Janthinobacterium sp. SUN026]|uniref:hypothetical protein n=1 Tax=Janthinobacterium sp. SUN026 TaxID=3002438 RepID=UPI0025B1AD02|nr:hypothetical protein [Janthinobacterium sp. SUN026]MDN2670716.1 hypothetical protein [Janthinobacterium sp. SUN026]
MHLLQRSIFALALSLPLPSLAQTTVTPIYMLLQPLVQRDANGVDICGVDATAAVVIDKKLETYEFQFYVSASTFSGHIDAGQLIDPTTPTPAGKQQALPRPAGFWIANKDNGEALHARDIKASGKPGHMAGTADLIPATRQLMNLIEGEKMQISIEYPKQRSQTIIEFSQRLADEDHDTMLSCMKDQMVSIRREYDAHKQK